MSLQDMPDCLSHTTHESLSLKLLSRPPGCEPVPYVTPRDPHPDSTAVPPNSELTFIFLEAVSVFSLSCRPLGARSVEPGPQMSVPVFLGRELRAQIEISTEEASSSAPPGHCVRPGGCACVPGRRGRGERAPGEGGPRPETGLYSRWGDICWDPCLVTLLCPPLSGFRPLTLPFALGGFDVNWRVQSANPRGWGGRGPSHL